ncbi:MAG: YgjV family protein, partial [Pseudomonadota bacterium]
MIAPDFPLSQGLAALAFALGVLGFLQHSRQRLLVLWALASTANAAHFLALAAPVSALFAGVSALRFAVAAVTTSPVALGLIALLTVAALAAPALGFAPASEAESGGGWLAGLATLLGVLAAFQRDERRVRLGLLLSTFLWLLNNIAL